MAVPKKKTAKSASRSRRSTYINLQRKRLTSITNIIVNKKTWEASLNHRLPESWVYKWIQIKTPKTKTAKQPKQVIEV